MRLITFLFIFTITLTAFGQVEITGIVTDAETGDPLIGPSIIVKGATAATFANLDGSFNLLSEKNTPTLVISYTGYETMELSPIHFDNISIELVIDLNAPWEICTYGPRRGILIGPLYDFTNALAGIDIDNYLPRFLFGRPLKTKAAFRVGNNNQLSLETSNEFTIFNFVHNGLLSLVLEYDLLKNGHLFFDVHDWPDFQRFALTPSISKGSMKIDIGYIYQSQLGFKSEDQHGLVLGVGTYNVFRSHINIQGRAELFLSELQFKLKANKYMPTIRTFIGLNYDHYQGFKALSLSAQYRFWY